MNLRRLCTGCDPATSLLWSFWGTVCFFVYFRRKDLRVILALLAVKPNLEKREAVGSPVCLCVPFTQKVVLYSDKRN